MLRQANYFQGRRRNKRYQEPRGKKLSMKESVASHTASLQQIMIVVQQQQINQFIQAIVGQIRESTTVTNGVRMVENSSPNPADIPRSTPFTETEGRLTTTWAPNGAVQVLASQIPEYAGQEEVNVKTSLGTPSRQDGTSTWCECTG